MTNANTLRIHSFLPASKVNGPGDRCVVWVQGCSLACAGCFNPESHSSAAGEETSIDELFGRIEAIENIEGVTISGGEPLQQSEPVIRLLERIRSKTNLTSLVFTGFSFDEAKTLPAFERLRSCVDVLICGRFQEDKRLAEGLIGSSNKTVHFFSDRYNMSDLDGVPDCEVIISADGEVVFSGIDPLRFREGRQ